MQLSICFRCLHGYELFKLRRDRAKVPLDSCERVSENHVEWYKEVAAKHEGRRRLEFERANWGTSELTSGCHGEKIVNIRELYDHVAAPVQPVQQRTHRPKLGRLLRLWCRITDGG